MSCNNSESLRDVVRANLAIERAHALISSSLFNNANELDFVVMVECETCYSLEGIRILSGVAVAQTL